MVYVYTLAVRWQENSGIARSGAQQWSERSFDHRISFLHTKWSTLTKKSVYETEGSGLGWGYVVSQCSIFDREVGLWHVRDERTSGDPVFC